MHLQVAGVVQVRTYRAACEKAKGGSRQCSRLRRYLISGAHWPNFHPLIYIYASNWPNKSLLPLLWSLFVLYRLRRRCPLRSQPKCMPHLRYQPLDLILRSLMKFEHEECHKTQGSLISDSQSMSGMSSAVWCNEPVSAILTTKCMIVVSRMGIFSVLELDSRLHTFDPRSSSLVRIHAARGYSLCDFPNPSWSRRIPLWHPDKVLWTESN